MFNCKVQVTINIMITIGIKFSDKINQNKTDEISHAIFNYSHNVFIPKRKIIRQLLSFIFSQIYIFSGNCIPSKLAPVCKTRAIFNERLNRKSLIDLSVSFKIGQS